MTHTGQHLTQEHKHKISMAMPTKKPVICIETGQEFDSIRTAVKAIGERSMSNLTAAIARKGTCRGYHWAWKKKTE